MKYLYLQGTFKIRLTDWTAGHWSEPRCLPSSKVRNYKPLFSSLTSVLSIQAGSVGNSSSVLVIKLNSGNHHLTYEEYKFQEFQEYKCRAEKSNMDRILTVKRQQGKGPGDFRYIVSSLVPTGYPTRAAFLAFPALWFHIFWLLQIIQE